MVEKKSLRAGMETFMESLRESIGNPNNPINERIRADLISKQIKRGEVLSKEDAEFYSEWCLKNG